MTFDPNAPGTPTAITVDPAPLTTPDGLACPSTTQCSFVDIYNHLVTFNPNAPGTPTVNTIDSGIVNGTPSLACPSTSECLAADGASHAVEGDPGNPSSWRVVPIAGANLVTGVACSSVAQCVVVDQVGNGFVGFTAPVVVSPPSISGSAIAGKVLTESHGSWLGGPTGYMYQWQRCDSTGNGCAAIFGATGQTYTLSGSDVGSTIRVQETASNAAGASMPATSTQTAVVSAASSGGGGGPPPPPPPPPPGVPPKVTGYRITNNPFVVGAAGTPVIGTAAAAQHKKGTTFEYTLSEPATVKIVISQRTSGRRKGKSCVAATKKLRKAKKCIRTVKRGTLTRTSHVGENRVAFSGRIGSRALKPGRYLAMLIATDSAKRASLAQAIIFTIVAR